MVTIPKHSQSRLWPSEIVTLGLLQALKGVGNRAFYRSLFPQLSEQTRLFWLFKTHWTWTYRFLAQPTLLGVVDSYGIELIHPIREGRTPAQLGAKGKSNHRLIVRIKLCALVNRLGLVVGWTPGSIL